jgi:peptidoglycan hydrolase-like protein with peptidoglycan-binding domain
MFDVRIRSALAVSATALLLSGPAFGQQQAEPPVDQQPEQQAEQPLDQQPEQQAEQPLDQDLEQQQAEQQPQAIPEAMGAPLHLSADDVRAVQEALQQAGHEPGDPDGLWGDQSQAAMREFQEAEGLPVSGNIDMGSIRALDLWDSIMSAEGTPARTEPDTAADTDQDTQIDTAAPDEITGPEDDFATEDPDQDAMDDTGEPAN